MSGAAMEPTRAAKGGDLSELQRSFRVFTQVSQDLERVYSRLESRAAVVESRLMEGNRRLTERVADLSAETDELQGILEAIPCGVVVCDSSIEITASRSTMTTSLGSRSCGGPKPWKTRMRAASCRFLPSRLRMVNMAPPGYSMPPNRNAWKATKVGLDTRKPYWGRRAPGTSAG